MSTKYKNTDGRVVKVSVEAVCPYCGTTMTFSFEFFPSDGFNGVCFNSKCKEPFKVTL